jgi:hypothetical protein
MVAALGRDCVADSLFILSASDCAVPESLTFSRSGRRERRELVACVWGVAFALVHVP